MLETTVARLLQSACQDKNDQEKVMYTTSLATEGIAILKQAFQDKKTMILETILTRCYAVILMIRRKFR